MPINCDSTDNKITFQTLALIATATVADLFAPDSLSDSIHLQIPTKLKKIIQKTNVNGRGPKQKNAQAQTAQSRKY